MFMRLSLVLAAMVIAGQVSAHDGGLIAPPIMSSPVIAGSATGWWVVVATGAGLPAGISDDARKAFGRGIRSAVAACGYEIFEENSGQFTGFPENNLFQVYAIGGYKTRGAAQHILDKIKPCAQKAIVKSMSLQSE